MNIDSYLKRIRYRGSRAPSLEVLRDLHRAHLLTVPFENLDIHLSRKIVLNDEALFEKVVTRRRGGFCYELNGLFAALLRSLNFDVSMLSAGVARKQGGFGAPFDHMTLLVKLHEPWIADVRFGESFVEPLRLDPGVPQYQWGKTYRLSPADNGEMLYESAGENGEWNPEYRFGFTPYQYADYEDRCLYHQTSPESSFTQKRVCSRATPDGRITLSDNKLIITREGKREESKIEESEYPTVLREYFGVVI